MNRFVAALVFSLGVSSAYAGLPEFQKRLFASITKSTPIQVELLDEAKGGCWTNATSAKRNLIGELKEKGFNPVEYDTGLLPYMTLSRVSKTQHSRYMFWKL
jgi:hypothetical protein